VLRKQSFLEKESKLSFKSKDLKETEFLYFENSRTKHFNYSPENNPLLLLSVIILKHNDTKNKFFCE